MSTKRAFAHTFGFLIAMAAALPGCERIDDAPKLRDEASATAASYDARLVEIGKRIVAIAPHMSAPPGRIRVDGIAMAAIQAAGRTVDQAREELSQVKGKAEGEARLAETEAYAAHVEALEKLIVEMHEHADKAVRLATAQLDAAESWLVIAIDKQDEAASAPSGSSGNPGSSAPAAPGDKSAMPDHQ